MSVRDRLAALGLELPATASPVGAYVPALRSGGAVHTSGQLPFVDGTLPATGKVGVGARLVDPATATELARAAALNAVAAVGAVLAAEQGTDPSTALDAVVRVVAVTGYVASDPSFTGQPGVLNGASTLLHEIFGAAGVHVRAAVGVAVLPLDAPVEVSIVVEAPPGRIG